VTRLLSLATAKKLFLYLLVCYFLGWAAFYFVTTLVAIANFAWRQPMFDQWVMYQPLLTLPFPDDIIQLANGHRPIIPNLVRLAEIHWFSANQMLQISVGTSCAVLTLVLVLTTVWRERGLSVASRSAMTLVATLGVFWLANVRMLLHGNESLHVYIPTLMVAAACLWTYQAKQRQSLYLYALATGACVVAMFSFGSGVAAFAAIVVLAIALRLPWRWLLLPGVTLIVCVVVYARVLPGGEGIRGMIALRPLDSLLWSARWLSAPWVNGWLGFSDPPLYRWMGAEDHILPLAVRSSALLATNATGLEWRTLSTWIGLAGIFAFGACCVTRIFSSRRPDRLETVTFGFGVFALAVAGVIGFGRLDYLEQNADQVYADRYLVWPSLFWMSVALLVILSTQRNGKAIARFGAYAFCAALPLLLLVSHSAQAIWGAVVFRIGQQTAASLRSGIYDAEHFPGPRETQDSAREQIGTLREHRMAMFADNAWERIGTHWSGSLASSRDVVAEAHWLPPVTNSTDSPRPAGHVEGWVTNGIAVIQPQQHLALLSDNGTIAGLGEFSFVKPNTPALLFHVPRKRGFDAYVRDYDSHSQYSLALLDFASNRGVLLKTLQEANK